MNAVDVAPIITTPRLCIRPATTDDVELFYALWTNPRVMTNVGFPHGLRIMREEIRTDIARRGTSEFDQLLVVELATGESIGECKMNAPDTDGIATTDVKLLPAFWGNHYGIEIKRALLDYLFTHTDCIAVQATPNVENIASIKMQESVGGMRVGESVFEFPATLRDMTRPVHHYIYRVSRADWLHTKSR